MSNATLTKRFLNYSSYQEFNEPVGQSHGVAQFTIELPSEIEFRVEDETSSATAFLDVIATLTAFMDSERDDKVFELTQKHRFIISIQEFYLSETDEGFAAVASEILSEKHLSSFINISCRDSVKQVINATRFSNIEIPYNVEWSV
ncbi:hypothetical protein [Shewanella xiamenensis]|uniref:hypothetical protein n=1 Tax=Shewanella xiamenensis TaxID=332186 RepID=UPI002E7BE2AF|nr:hypothetical protein [Shewanella xiamenensis]